MKILLETKDRSEVIKWMISILTDLHFEKVTNKYFPIEFSSYEDYIKYLKEKSLALEAPEGMYNIKNK